MKSKGFRIRNSVVAALAGVALVIGIGAPAPAQRASRTASRAYSGYLLDWAAARCGARLHGFFGAHRGPTVVFKPPRTDESFVGITIEDQLPGQRTIAVVNQSGRAFSGKVVCGSTLEPLPVRHDKPIYVQLFDGVSEAGPSVVSGGTVTATFYATTRREATR